MIKTAIKRCPPINLSNDLVIVVVTLPLLRFVRLSVILLWPHSVHIQQEERSKRERMLQERAIGAYQVIPDGRERNEDLADLLNSVLFCFEFVRHRVSCV